MRTPLSLVLLLLLLVIGLSGCTQQQQPQMYVCSSGDVVSNSQLCPGVETQGNEGTQANQQHGTQPCPYDCCDSEKYDYKGCQTGKQCTNNTCVQQSCPFECCDGSVHLKKDCAYNKECLNNQCVTAQCPYACCTGDVYMRKDCSEDYLCLNNSCSAIPIPKITLTVDACVTSQNITQMLGEVTDIYITVENYGTKEAVNLELSSTANDVEQNIANAHGIITALPAKAQKSVKLTVDTDSAILTAVTVTASCQECEPQTVSISEPNCQYNFEAIAKKAIEYAPVIGGFIG